MELMWGKGFDDNAGPGLAVCDGKLEVQARILGKIV